MRGRYPGTAPPLQEAGATTVISAELEASVEVTAFLLRMYGVAEEEIDRQKDLIRGMSCSMGPLKDSDRTETLETVVIT